MIEILLTIIILALIWSFIYREKSYHKSQIEIVDKILKQNEIDKHNLITALKSYTAQDYSASAVYPDIKVEEPQKEEDDEFQELDELAEQDPEKFDKIIGV